MIIGNPYEFAVIVKTINEWNLDNTFCNGILLFIIDGIVYPREIVTAPLKSEIIPLKQRFENIGVCDKIFSMEKNLAFAEMYNITFPLDTSLENDYQFYITPLSFPEDSCYVFAVSNGTHVRVLASKLTYDIKESRHLLENIVISESFVSVEDIKRIATTLVVD